MEGAHMACVNPDGTLSKTAMKILEVIKVSSKIEEISAKTEVPIFLLRSSMRDLVDAGVAKAEGEQYVITDKGKVAAAK
jgi:predicted transcriptional regulator